MNKSLRNVISDDDHNQSFDLTHWRHLLMSSREILVQFLLGNQLTSRLSLPEFQEVVDKNSGQGERIPDEKVREWYAAYRARDQDETDATRLIVDKFLTITEQAEMRKLENAQLKESLSLEEVVDSMYNVDQILDARLKTLNRAMETNVKVLAKLNDILAKVNRSKAEDDNIDLLNVLHGYKTMIEDDE